MALRDGVVRAVTTEGMPCHAAAARSGSRRVRRSSGCSGTGTRAARHRGEWVVAHQHSVGATWEWLLERVTRDFTLRGLVAELGTRGVNVDYMQVWRFARAQGLS